jgi:hypothetical protein
MESPIVRLDVWQQTKAMPELPEVEHVVRALRRVVAGRRIVATLVQFSL